MGDLFKNVSVYYGPFKDFPSTLRDFFTNSYHFSCWKSSALWRDILNRRSSLGKFLNGAYRQHFGIYSSMSIAITMDYQSMITILVFAPIIADSSTVTSLFQGCHSGTPCAADRHGSSKREVFQLDQRNFLTTWVVIDLNIPGLLKPVLNR